MQIMYLVIIIVLIAYILFFHHEIHQLHQQIQDKKATQSKVRILKRHPLLNLNPIIDDYNLIFDDLLESQQTYIQERQMLDRIIHNISHDIRTPLTVSWGYIRQLLKEDPHHPILLKVDDALDRVSTRLENLLEYQQLMEGQTQPTWVRMNLSQELSQALMQFYDIYTQAHFDVNIDISEHIWIDTDQQMLDRILQNLLGNVAKHGRGSVQVKLYTQQNQAHLIISNHTKQAIAHVEKLTQRFYAEDLSSSERSSGLGLYITQRLVELTHGDMSLSYQDDLYTVAVAWPLSSHPQ